LTTDETTGIFLELLTINLQIATSWW